MTAGESKARIVLVSGAPGSGKTTFARPLARTLGFALISKDDIKEPMFDALEALRGDLPVSRKIGSASWEVMWLLARHAPRLVLEANFHPDSAYEKERILALSAQIIEVHCRCSPSEAARRFNARAQTTSRHSAHAAISEVSATDIAKHFAGPLGIGTLIEVDTTVPIDIGDIAGSISRAWR